jgi:adenosylhomocysteine nucleosidase
MSDERLTALVARAFDYRGYVTLKRRDGSELVGFVYDRGEADLTVLDESATRRIRVPLDDIADIAFTGEDPAEKAQRIWEKRKGALEPGSTSAWGDWDEERPALIVAALDQELRCIARAMGATPRGRVARGRLNGGSAAAVAVGVGGGARQAVTAEKPRAVASAGFAGGLVAGLSPGDLVLASSVRDESGECIAATPSLREAARTALAGLRFVEGEIVCATRIAGSPAEKRALAGTAGIAVDMETWAVASAAREAGIPWMALRVVLDPLEWELPAFARETHESYVRPALRHALRGPRATVELARLATSARTAAHALEQGLKRVGPSLAAAGRSEAAHRAEERA